MAHTSPKYQEAESRIPNDLRPLFKRLVEEYKYLTVMHYRRGYVAYKVLADMLLAGWRPTGKPIKESNLFKE